MRAERGSGSISQRLKTGALLLGVALLVMWVMEISDFLFFGGALDWYGVRPRSVGGLGGVILMPFLHADFGHLVTNTAGLCVFGLMISLDGRRRFVATTVLSLLASGLGIWLLGWPGSVHIGASGVTFGYMGYLFLRGYFARSMTALAISLVLVSVYGGALVGLLPLPTGSSWEGHLFGFIGGGFSAYLFHRRRP